MIQIKIIRLLIFVLLIIIDDVHSIDIYNKKNNKIFFGGNINAFTLFNTGVKQNSNFLDMHLKSEIKITEALIGYSTVKYKLLKKLKKESYIPIKKDNINLAFFGFKYGSLGSLDYGKNFSLLYHALSVKKTLNKLNNSIDEMFLLGRTDNLFTYRNQNFFNFISGLDIALQYQVKNISFSKKNNAYKTNRESYAFCSSYKHNKNLFFTAAYGYALDTNIKNKFRHKSRSQAQNIWGLSFQYHSKNLYLSSSYSKILNSNPIFKKNFLNKNKIIELVAQYEFFEKIKSSVVYVVSKSKDIENIGYVDLNKFISIGATYKINKHLSIFLEHQINLIKKNDTLKKSHNNITALGFNYKF